MRLLAVPVLLTAGLAVSLALPGCDPDSGRLKVAFISNNTAEFWAIARNGTRKAAKDFDVDVEFYMPPLGTAAEQHYLIEDLIVKGVRGIAISPNNALHQSRVLNRIIPDDVAFITQDSDLPTHGPNASKRLCYIGTNNVKAGRAVGELVKEALPGGGEVMIFVGVLDAQNAQERRQGVIAALAGLPDTDAGDTRALDLGKQAYPIRLGPGGKYVVLGTVTDEVSASRCKENAVDVLKKKIVPKAMVGLWAYNPPAILQAVKDRGQEGKIIIVGFDEDEQTLQGIKDGYIYATVVQNPYLFGYEAVRIMQHKIRYGVLPEAADKMVTRKGDLYFVKHRVIRRRRDVKPGQLFDEDVEAFHADLKKKER